MKSISARRKPVSSQDIKKANRNRIYRYIHGRPGASRPELVQRLGMSLPTVMRNVKSLFEEGLLKEDGSLESTGGRKATALSCVGGARAAVGVDVTRDHLGMVIVDLHGTVVKSARRRLEFARGAQYADRLGKAVGELVKASGVAPEAVLGVGVSMPGILSADGSVFSSRVLSEEEYRTGVIFDALPYPAVFLNDANAAGVAEMWDSESGRSFVHLSLSNSVGGAIIADGRLSVGDNQRAGEFGHITVAPAGVRCYCGQKGCLDAYCAASLLSARTGGDLGEFFRRLELGDDRLAAAWNAYLEPLARAVNILRMTFDCEVVVGGYVGAFMEKHIEELRRRVGLLNTFEKSGAYVRVCRRRTEASAVGAALIHIQNFIREI